MATQPDFADDFEEDDAALDLDADDDQPDDTGEDTTDADAEQQDGDEEVDVVSLGSDAIQSEDEPEGMRNLREALKREKQLRKDAEARGAPKVDQVGEKPNMDDYWEKPEDFEKDLLAWSERKRAAEAEQGEAEKLNQSVTDDVAAGQRAYQEQRASLRIPGFEAADDKVVDALPEIFLNAVNLAGGDKAAALRFYLGTHPDQLSKITALNPRKVTDLIKVAALAGSMAKEINVQRRKPATAPDTNHSARGTSGGGGGRGDQRRARLEAEADRSGDYSALIKYDSDLERKK